MGMKCKAGEKMEILKDKCGCTVYECKPAEVCRAECKAGEEAKEEKVVMCREVTTMCRHQRTKALARSLFIDGAFIPVCDAAGHFAKRQSFGAVSYCVDPKTGVKISGTEGLVGTVTC